MKLKIFYLGIACLVVSLFFQHQLAAQSVKLELSCDTDSALFIMPLPSMSGFEGSHKINLAEFQIVVASKKGYRPKSVKKLKRELIRNKTIHFDALDKFPTSSAFLNMPIHVEGVKWNIDSIWYIYQSIDKYNKVSLVSNKILSQRSAGLSAKIQTTAILQSANLLDTTKVKKGFRDSHATLQISVELDSLTFYIQKFKSEDNFTCAHAFGRFKWSLLDPFGQPFYSKVIDAESIEYPTFCANTYSNTLNQTGYDDLIFNTLISEALYQFLTDPELDKSLQTYDQRLNAHKSYPPLELSKNNKSKKTIKDGLQSTVSIKLKDSHGGGVVLSQDGYIATNYHVVGNDSTVKVVTYGGDTLIGTVVRVDPTYDLALIKCDNSDFQPFQISQNKVPDLGSDVYAIGTPVDVTLGQTINRGIISAYRNFHNRELYQTDVRVSGGNSGGALVNENGELVGIVSSKIIGYGVEGICFAIPSKYIFERLRIKFQ